MATFLIIMDEAPCVTDTLAPAPEAVPPSAGVDPGPRRWRRRLGTTLIALGIVALLYGAAIYFWRDPVTDLYARWKQSQLSDQLAEEFAEFRGTPSIAADAPTGGVTPETSPLPPSDTTPATTPDEQEPVTPTVVQATADDVHQLALRYRRSLAEGDPMGRLRIPRIDIHPVFVNGTRWGADLSRGPGRYPETSLPGLGELTAIAGHRTTFGAPFRHIDRLEAGDAIVLELPYGTFHYLVVEHEIVDDEDWSIIEPRPYETLVLSACHPLYSASQRWIVYARLDRVELPDGRVYVPA